jgi:hypothetical protein
MTYLVTREENELLVSENDALETVGGYLINLEDGITRNLRTCASRLIQ